MDVSFLVMELARGGELRAKLSETSSSSTQIGLFTEERARSYWQQLLQAMLYCHRKGVWHGDLQLENLLLDETHEALKITGFGLRWLRGDYDGRAQARIRAGVVVSELRAPEVYESSVSGYDRFLADVWSCGIVLYVMTIGQHFCQFAARGQRRNPPIYELAKSGVTQLLQSLPSCVSPTQPNAFSK